MRSILRDRTAAKLLRVIRYFVTVALASVIVGCAQQSTPPAETLNLVRAGQPLLTCREACLTEWRRVQPQAAQLDAAGRWQDLALLLVQARYQDDLTLYYLGRAAEGMGAHAAAGAYYLQSMQFSGTSASCQQLSRLCGGVALPRAAAARAAAIERAMARARYHRTGPSTGSEAPEAAPEEIAEPPPMPGPIAIPAPAPQPLPSPSRAPASEYIEPPPAAR